jgi:hypothetical protein
MKFGNIRAAGQVIATGSLISSTVTLITGSAQVVYTGLTGIPSGIVSGSGQIPSLLPSGTVSGSSQVDVLTTTNIARLATTGSNTFGGNQTINGSLVVTGSLTAQQFIVSSSVTYLTESFASGSHKFGDSSDDTHQFTGSIFLNGSIVTTATGSIGTYTTPTSGGTILTAVGSGSATSAQVFTTTNHASFFEANTNSGSIVTRLQSQNASFVGTMTNNTFDIVAGGNVVIHATGSGLVGINMTKTPNATLDVNGNTLITGSLGINTAPISTFGVSMKRAVGSSGNLYLIGNDTVVGMPNLNFYNDNNTSGSYISMNTVNGLNLNGIVNISGSNVGFGTSAPSYPIDMTTSVSGTFSTIAQFQNTNYTAGNKTFIRVRAWANAGGSYSSYFGTGQDGNLYMIANDSARGGDLIINAGTGGVTLSSTVSAGDYIKGTCTSSYNGDGIRVYASTTGGAGSQPGIGYWTAAGSKRFINQLDVTSDTWGLVNASGTNLISVTQAGATTIGGTSHGYLYLNAVNSGGNESGIYHQIGGTNKWEVYTAANDTAMNWYSYAGGSIVLKLSTGGNLTVSGTLTENSSIRYKENIETIKYGLDKVLQMRGVTYTKKDNDIKELGLIAEEVNEILPEIVLKNKEGEPDSVSYSRITAVLIEAIKELKSEIEELKSNR